MKRSSDRQFLFEENGRRLMSMLQRFSQVRELAVRLPPGMSHSDLRRTAARLRNGTIRGIDPRIPPSALAAAIEASVAQDQLARSVAMDMIEYRRMSEAVDRKEAAERARQFVAGFHQLKKAPEASDPESSVADEVRRINRTRRKEHGRARKGRKKE